MIVDYRHDQPDQKSPFGIFVKQRGCDSHRRKQIFHFSQCSSDEYRELGNLLHNQGLLYQIPNLL